MFPVTLHELLRLLRRGSETRPVTPGAGWVLEALTQRDGALAASDPAGQPVAGQVLASGRTTRLAMPPARLPGLFMVSQGGAVVGAEAVNIDPRESDTRPLALEQFKPGAAGALAVVHNEEDLLLAGKSRPLWPHLAAAVAALLGLEMLLLALWRPWRARATPAPARPAMNLEVRP